MKVSVIICAYNSEKFISRTIRSCIEQSLSRDDFEIIVVDDGSTDNTKNVLASFGDWIRVLTLPKNMGLPYACNVGIKQALSRYVVRVDADDYIHEDFLKVGYLFLSENQNLDSVAFDYYHVDDREEKISKMDAKENPIACGIFFRKDQLIDLGLYDENFRLGEDEDLRIRFLQKHTITYIPLPLYRYRKHENNSTNNVARVEKYNKMLRDKHKC